MTLDLPDALWRELKMRADRDGLKMKQLLTNFIEDGLRDEKVVSNRSPLPVARQATGVSIPALSNARIAAILDAEDADACR